MKLKLNAKQAAQPLLGEAQSIVFSVCFVTSDNQAQGCHFPLLQLTLKSTQYEGL